MTFAECLEPNCVQPVAKTDQGHWMSAVDFDGVDVELWADTYICAAGHRYHLIDESKTVINV